MPQSWPAAREHYCKMTGGGTDFALETSAVPAGVSACSGWAARSRQLHPGRQRSRRHRSQLRDALGWAGREKAVETL